MLAGRVQRDVPHNDELFVVDREGRRQDLSGVLAQPGKEFGIRSRDAGRGLLQTLAVRILANGDQQLPNRGLGPRRVDRWMGPVRGLRHRD